MGIIDFFKDALGGNPDADDIKKQIAGLGLKVQNFGVEIQNGTAILTGLAADRPEASKIVMAVGNTKGIAKVDNRMRVPLSTVQPAAATTTEAPQADDHADEEAVVFYPVEKGETLSGIAKRLYGDANKYMKIFEANRPMLSDPDKIYPGQVLRVPPLQ